MDAEPSQPNGLQDFLTWLEVNKVRVAVITACVSAVIIIVVVYLHQESQREIRASEALSEIRTPVNPTAPLAPETIQAYLELAASHSGSKAAARAILRVAGSYFLDGNYTEAQSAFERFQKEYPNSEWADQAALGLAACTEAQGQMDLAAAKYEEVRSRYPNTSVADEATLGLARVQEAQGKKEEAFKLYYGLSESSQSSLGARAGMRKEEMLKLDPSLTNAIAPILPIVTTPQIPPPIVVGASNIQPTPVIRSTTDTNVVQPTDTNTPQVPVPVPVQPPTATPGEPKEKPAPAQEDAAGAPTPDAPVPAPKQPKPDQPPSEESKPDQPPPEEPPKASPDRG